MFSRSLSLIVKVCALLVLIAAGALLGGLLTPSPPRAQAADVTGTDGNDLLTFQAALGPLSTVITNPYSGDSIALNGTFNVNAVSYDGLAGQDILLMTNFADVLLLRDPVTNSQMVFNIELFFAGSGQDVIHLADATFILGEVFIDGGEDADIIWANAGNDLINGRGGNDIVDGGPGIDRINGGDDNDTLNGGDGDDRINGDAGDDDITFHIGFGIDTVDGGDGFDEIVFLSPLITTGDLTITPTGGATFNIVVGIAGDEINASNVEQVRFDDGTTLALTAPPTPTPTPTSTPTATATPTPTPTPCPDFDGDTICDDADPDDDNDGCTDVQEQQPKSLAAAGGGRDPNYFWDFFDVWTLPGPAKDRRIDGFDINAVVLRFGAALATPLTKEAALIEALTTPTDQTSYHAAFDRDTSDPEANLWNVRPPNGRIDGFDIGFVVVQFGHSCAVLP